MGKFPDLSFREKRRSESTNNPYRKPTLVD